jgi:antitoxin component of RelBE/YafQ-DinJ toxin-antitoxin module
MTPQQALAILNQVARRAAIPWDDHMAAQQALKVLTDLVNQVMEAKPKEG